MNNWCKTWEQDISKHDLVKYINQRMTSSDGSWWNLYEEKEDFDDYTAELRKELEHKVNDKLVYMGVWDYYPGYVDELGPHIDNGGKENAVIFVVPKGELTVTLHNTDTKQVIESKKISGNTAMALHHTKFMHDIHGQGLLVVFGISKNFDAEEYFNKDVIS